jgi:hypothetical protein
LHGRLFTPRRTGDLCPARGRHYADGDSDPQAFGDAVIHIQPYTAVTFGNGHKHCPIAHANCHCVCCAQCASAHGWPKLDTILSPADRHRHAGAAHSDASAQRDANSYTQTICYCIGHIGAFRHAAANSHVHRTGIARAFFVTMMLNRPAGIPGPYSYAYTLV